jgi:hypothetical protein
MTTRRTPIASTRLGRRDAGFVPDAYLAALTATQADQPALIRRPRRCEVIPTMFSKILTFLRKNILQTLTHLDAAT